MGTFGKIEQLEAKRVTVEILLVLDSLSLTVLERVFLPRHRLLVRFLCPDQQSSNPLVDSSTTF